MFLAIVEFSEIVDFNSYFFQQKIFVFEVRNSHKRENVSCDLTAEK